MGDQLALVTGATGAIGPRLVAELIQQGWQVRVLSRQRPTKPLFPDGVEFIPGDIGDREIVRAAVADAQLVFHLAALLHVTNPPPELRAEYERVNVDATRIVAQEAASASVQRMIYFSTVKVYGVQQAQPVTEDNALDPKTDYAKSKLSGERAALDHMETTILRLSPIYGARLRGSWRYLVTGINKGLFLPVGSLKNTRSLTHVDDASKAALLVANSPSCANQAYNLVAHDSVNMEAILDAIYAAFGKRRPRIGIPAPLVHGGVGLAEIGLGLIGKRSPLTRESIGQLTQSETYSGAKLRALGFQPQVSLAEGWQQTVKAILAET
ncbi:MAG: NAD-dependent epimerase/dehydratase family protein [Anaerolinea sp.]|nr:NAD-dependent epimerase/dehydratase family protein [Anaerolinea sp.]